MCNHKFKRKCWITIFRALIQFFAVIIYGLNDIEHFNLKDGRVYCMTIFIRLHLF